MKTITQILTVSFSLLVLAFSHTAVAGDAADFSHYQVILDREPFGEPPPDNVGSNSVPSPQSFIRDLKMVAITECENGDLKVGFVDVKAGNKSYYLSVGEQSDDGIEVVDADYGSESALLKKGSDSQWLNMNSDQTNGQQQSLVSPSVKAVDSGRHAAFANRIKSRRDSVSIRELQPPTMTGEELEKHLKNYQMDLIRARGANGPPLPLELTPEMDSQLVSEGVLPPIDQSEPAADTPAEATPPAGE